jgi:hypothetical protein
VSSERRSVTAYAGSATVVVSVLLVTAAPAHWLKLIGALTFASIACGAGVMSWIDTGSLTAQAGMVLVVSLALFALIAAVMIWISAWHPVTAFVVIAAASLASCIARLVTFRTRLTDIDAEG